MEAKMISNKVYNDLETNYISPSLEKTYVFNLDCSDWKIVTFDERRVKYYEFEFILKSEGSMIHEGIKYPLKPGDLCFKKPGEITQGVMPYSCFMVSFKMNENQNPFQQFENEIIKQLPAVHSTKNSQYFEFIFKKILNEYLSETVISTLKIRSYILDLIFSLYEEVQQNYLPSSPYYSVIMKAFKYIDEHYQQKISLDDIASYVGMSSFYFQRIFKQTMQQSPNVYLINYRINLSKQLLIMTTESITDIAFKCGFESTSYFCYNFKQKFNISPNNYRKSHKIL